MTSYNLCRINMFLHGVEFDKFDIACEDTLTNPQHWDDEPFELICTNPPYSVKWKGSDDATLINDPRFSPAGVLAPKSKADMAVHHALPVLAGGQRHGGYRLLPWHHVPGRRRKENSAVSHRQRIWTMSSNLQTIYFSEQQSQQIS